MPLLPDNYSLVLATAPSATKPVVSVADAKMHMRVESDDENDYIGALIATAVLTIEAFLRRKLITQDWKLYLDGFPFIQNYSRCRTISFPFSPVQSVTSVKYYDTNGVQQTLAPNTDYDVHIEGDPGFIVPSFSRYWPVTRLMPNAVEIVYKVGYGDDATKIPPPIVHAVKMLANHWYENREPVSIGNISSELPYGPERLCWPYRALEF